MHFCLQVFAFQMISHISLKAQGGNSCHQLRIFLKRFYLASTGRTRIWMVFKRALLLLQLLEYRGENVHKHTHKHTHVCVCMQNLHVPVPLTQVTVYKTTAQYFQSLFDPYFILSLLFKWLQFLYLFERSCHAYWYSKDFKISQEKVLQLSRKWCYSPECW